MAKALCSLQCKSVDLKGMKYTDSSEKGLIVNEGEKYMPYLSNCLPCALFSYPFQHRSGQSKHKKVESSSGHIQPHHKLMSVTRQTGHSCGVLKGRSNFDQTAA